MERLIPPLVKGELNTIITFDSTGDKTTELFYIPSDTWRINWTFSAGGAGSAVIFIDVYKHGENGFPNESASAVGGGSHTTYIYEGFDNFLYFNNFRGRVNISYPSIHT